MSGNAVFSAARVANEDLSAWLPDHSVIVENGLITGVTPTSQLPSEIGSSHTVHDLGDVSLLPGLMDAHFHMEFGAHDGGALAWTTEYSEARVMQATDNLRRNLMVGLTTSRDLGTRNETTFAILDALKNGLIPGPRVIPSGSPVTISGGHMWPFGSEADSTDQVVTAVRRQVRLGAKVIKVAASGGRSTPTANPRKAQYSAETLEAAVTEAHRSGVPIVAHTLAADGVRNCVEAGVDHLIHGKWYQRDPGGGLDYDQKLVDKMAEQGQWVDPTIGSALLNLDAQKDNPSTTVSKIHWAVGADVPLEQHLENYTRMHDSGVRFTAGLDSGDLTNSTACSWAYVELLGWDNWSAIRSATSDNAEAFGIDDEVGRIRPGLVADLAAFKGDPAVNIRELWGATSVVQAGTPVKLHGETLI